MSAAADVAGARSARELAGLRRRIVGMRPRTPDDLRAWLRLVMGIEVGGEGADATPGGAAPFEYLCHAFLEEPGAARDCVVWACRGGGKTFYAAVATMLDLVFKPGIEVCILGGSAEQSERVHAHLRRLFESGGGGAAGRETGMRELLDGKPTRRTIRLLNGSVCEASAQSETSVRGRRPQKMRCDEVELFDPEVWRAALLAPRSKRCGRVWAHASVEALSTMHRSHGLMAELVSEAGSDSTQRRLFRWGVADVLERCEASRECETCALWPECGGRAKAPAHAGHVPIDDALAMKSRVGVSQWEAEMLCLRPSREDLVLPEFDVATHVFEEGFTAGGAEGAEKTGIEEEGCGDAARAVLVCGMDFGFRAPTVILWALVGADRVVRIVDERVVTETRLEEHARAMLDGRPRGTEQAPAVPRLAASERRANVDGRITPLRPRGGVAWHGEQEDRPSQRWPAPLWVGVDPAGHQRSEQTGISAVSALRKTGLTVRARRAGIEEGLRLVRARLKPATGSPTLFVHRRCVELIKSLRTYHYGAAAHTAGAPVKDGADHAVDALRYLIVNLDAEPTRRGSYL